MGLSSRLSCVLLLSALARAERIYPRQTLQGSWVAQGCITDNVGPRVLGGAAVTGPTTTTESCIAFCDSKGFIYAGTEYSAECYCGNSIGAGSTNAPLSDCNMPCAGNSAELCGAGGRLNLYWSGKTPPRPPSIVPSVGLWNSLGCYSDNVNGIKTLLYQTGVQGQVSIETCTSACFNKGYAYAGAEYAGECYCGSTINGGASVPATDCNMVCQGNSSEFCGAGNRLNLYKYTGTDLPTTPTVPPPPVGGGGGGGVPTTVFPVLSQDLPTGWSYNACWVDNAHGRIIGFETPITQTTTVQSCIGLCSAAGYKVAGIEFSSECYCGNELTSGATIATDGCTMGCAGNATQACGGANRLSVYSSAPFAALPVPTAMKTNLPGKWTYAGCLREPGVGVKIFGNEIIWPGNNSALACMTQCGKFGYTAAGVEYGQECYCGDVEDVKANGGVFGDESECSTPCPGDPLHLCGQGDRLNTYFWNGTVNNWHKPTNIGRYEFFVPGVIVPLIATVGINNKVTFLEKGGTGFPNTTGAYELDLSLSSNFSAMWREMHVKTDVFCAGSLILPDKAGRQINVGGWSLESTFGVRLFTPDGRPGVNGTNDWEEDYHTLSLQRGRWYPTAAMLANGTILIIGGETGSNADPQPNLEILPKPPGGDTVIELDWLKRTDPNNLYPFVVILPSQNIFIAYYNEARILDPATFATIKTLPNIPGAVNDFTAGRTYPLEGSMVPLPQKAPYTDPLEVLICGGSTIGAAYALDNCVTIAPEKPGADWTIERMPSRRVMACMASLPDGTVMIMNGAHHGVAGFGLAEDPNLNAVLYDPSQPIGSRFSILNDTIVPRMYHSEATLLPDGRVLVSGSDPQTNWANGTVRYNEEFRIEVYIPPYLNQGFKQPNYTLPVNDWAYGGKYQVTNVKLYQGTTSTVRFSLIAATSSTHGNTMGARTIFPAFTCAGTTCTITAPPNAGVSPPGWHMLFLLDGPTPSFAQWVRIGGDPSKLGQWPKLPGFKVPGI